MEENETSIPDSYITRISTETSHVLHSSTPKQYTSITTESTESSQVNNCSTIFYEDVTFKSPILEAKQYTSIQNHHDQVQDQNGHDSLISDDEVSLLSSTPKGNESNLGCDSHDKFSSGGKNLRVRRKECHRVHYTSDLDDSNLTFYEQKKRKKKRMTLFQSFSTDQPNKNEEVYLDTLENHLFPDMSFSDSELSYSGSKFVTPQMHNSSWSKLDGVSYSSKYDFSEDEDVTSIHRSINHPKRSMFRQKRRDWYLDRRVWHKRTKTHTSLWQKCIKRFLHIFFVTQIIMHTITRRISRKLHIFHYGTSRSLSRFLTGNVVRSIFFMYYIPVYIYRFMKAVVRSSYIKVTSLFVSSRAKVNPVVCVASKKSMFSCIFRIFYWVLLLFAILLAIITGFYSNQIFPDAIVPLPNPTKSGIDNAFPLYIDPENSKIPAWHIYPAHSGSSLDGKSPVIMYLRNYGDADSSELKTTYKTLSSLGYHMIVPTSILSQTEILQTWKWIKMQTKSTAYMWGFGMSAATLVVNAKLFCKDLIPPNGVIIAKKIKTVNTLQSIEIWSCSCALSQKGAKNDSSTTNGTDFKYNHVKCPIAFSNTDDDVYSQVVSCIETVNRDVK